MKRRTRWPLFSNRCFLSITRTVGILQRDQRRGEEGTLTRESSLESFAFEVATRGWLVESKREGANASPGEGHRIVDSDDSILVVSLQI
jgi:hypothetical protein